MKTLKNVTLLAVIALGMALFACQKEDVKTPETEDGISKEVKEKLIAIGLNPYGAYKKFIEYHDGTGEEVYIVENDIAISPKQLDNMQSKDGTNTEEHVGGLLSVGTSRTIYIKTHYGMDQTTKDALEDAMDWFNSLNLKLSFAFRSYGADIIVTSYPVGSSPQAISGLPDNGDPYHQINVSGISSISKSEKTRLFKHNLLHCIGLHHNDAMQSCGFDVVSIDDYPKLYIPDTPSGYYSADALMNSCYSLSPGTGADYVDVALQYLYGQ
jgi:hypothetical protein